MENCKKKCNSLSFKTKLEILKSIENGEQRKTVCSKYNCSAATLTRIIKSKATIQSYQESNLNLNKKRKRCGSQEKIEKALSMWFKDMRAKGATIPGIAIMEKAKTFANLLNVDFTPTVGWLDRWKKRENIHLKIKHGEKDCADIEGAENWLRTTIPKYLSEYNADCIYNADESALLFKTITSGTLCYRNEKVAGRKQCKDRITLLFVANASGDDKLMYSIGKSKNPRCFRNRTIPIDYFSNKNAWMTQEIWTNILTDINKKMKIKKRKIVLFVDNATCHNAILNLDYVKVVFLPPNTTSIIKPLDQGVIRSFKAFYRQDLIKKHILHIEAGKKSEQFTKDITVFDALVMAKRAWNNVTSTTIKNCFVKAHFAQSPDLEHNEEEVISMDERIENLIDIDSNLACFGTMTDDDIIATVSPSSNHDSESEYEEVEYVKPSLGQALTAIKTLKDYLNNNYKCLQHLDEIEHNLAKINFENLSQRKIEDYFNTLNE